MTNWKPGTLFLLSEKLTKNQRSPVGFWPGEYRGLNLLKKFIFLGKLSQEDLSTKPHLSMCVYKIFALADKPEEASGIIWITL